MPFALAQHGRGTGYNPKVSWAEFRYATKWALCQLMDQRLVRHLKINLIHLKPKSARAECEGIRIGDNNPRTFKVHVSNLPTHRRKTVLKLLFHELTHVKQYATGQLWDHETMPETVYNGRTYRRGKNMPIYKNQPWEKECWKSELELLERYEKMVDKPDF